MAPLERFQVWSTDGSKMDTGAGPSFTGRGTGLRCLCPWEGRRPCSTTAIETNRENTNIAIGLSGCHQNNHGSKDHLTVGLG